MTSVASPDSEYFTLVFAGDIGAVQGNPFHIITPYGTPIAVGRGNAFDRIDELEDEVSDLSSALQD